jgi:hypothetical protein
MLIGLSLSLITLFVQITDHLRVGRDIQMLLPIGALATSFRLLPSGNRPKNNQIIPNQWCVSAIMSPRQAPQTPTFP